MTLLLLLPLFTLIVFSFAFVSFFIQSKTKIRSICLKQSIVIQKDLIRSEEQLFKLNPLAVTLRLKLKAAYARLALAIATENPALAVEAERQIIETKNQQQELDLSQKALIRIAQTQLIFSVSQLQNQLKQNGLSANDTWSFYLRTFTHIYLTHSPNVAVKPDSPEVAPVYELDPEYQGKQNLAFRWQLNFQTQTEAQQQIRSETRFEMTCGSTAKKEKGGIWNVLINAGKF